MANSHLFANPSTQSIKKTKTIQFKIESFLLIIIEVSYWQILYMQRILAKPKMIQLQFKRCKYASFDKTISLLTSI